MGRYGEMPLQLWSLYSFLQPNRQTRLSIISIEQVAVIARVGSTGRRDFLLTSLADLAMSEKAGTAIVNDVV